MTWQGILCIISYAAAIGIAFWRHRLTLRIRKRTALDRAQAFDSVE